MSKAGKKVIRGLKEAIAHQKGEKTKLVVHVPARVDVKAIRARLGLSQAEFAKRFGFTLDSLQNWESERREPAGAARVLRTVIDKEPDAVDRALKVA